MIIQGAGDVQDIREEYDEEKEATWRGKWRSFVCLCVSLFVHYYYAFFLYCP